MATHIPMKGKGPKTVVPKPGMEPKASGMATAQPFGVAPATRMHKQAAVAGHAKSIHGTRVAKAKC